MDACKLCGSAITGEYYRIGPSMACAPCARQIAEEATRDPTPFILKGIVFAFLAACAGLLLRAAFEAILLSIGAGFLGGFLRWFVFLGIAILIGVVAKKGSSERGGIALQVSSVIFYYLAVSLAYLPILLWRNPSLPRSLATIWSVSIICLEIPFTAIARDFANITGLIAILLCMATLWSGTGPKPNPVEGPFEAATPGVESNFFKRKTPLPPS